jgi:long-chain acyl-CoA synthetase
MTETDRPEDMLRKHGDNPAVIMAASGESLTFAELDDRSTRLARVFAEAGLEAGDHVALMLGNQPAFFEVMWAALRSGLYLTPINWHLGADEAGYIIQDSQAKAFVTSASMSEVAAELDPYCGDVSIRLMVDGSIEGYDDLDSKCAAVSGEPRTDERSGAFMLYSSGTTGRPKGILLELSDAPFGVGDDPVVMLLSLLYGADSSSVYLSPAPLYHAAPLAWCAAVHRLGAAVVVMERFDPAAALAAVETYGITHAQFVPTHFVRMLRLSDDERSANDLSTLQKVVHAAAPCPVPVKHQMIEWLGPIVDEYYAGSEAFGVCLISAAEWLEHPGSVGKAMTGAAHIIAENGVELATGETGQVWFETEIQFEYNNDPEKTSSVLDDRGWATYGDVGYIDDEGFVYLTDRASNMIISGGVNIYPQEAENVLTVHPDVHDVAVIGVPDDDMGERVKAFIQLRTATADPDAKAAELIEHCRGELAHYKCPKEVEFVDELPRMDTGKLLKRRLLE